VNPAATALGAAALALAVWPAGGGGRAVRPSSLRWPPVPAATLALLGVPGAAVAGLFAGTPLVAALAAGCAFLAARGLRARGERARSEGRLARLTEALGALAAELRAGRPLEAATGAAVTLCHDDDALAGALARALRAPDTARGRDGPPGSEQALGRVATAVLLSARTGCSLAAVLTAVEDDLRARALSRRELRAALASPQASALLLAGLPVLALAMGSGIGADPWHVLTRTPIGQVLLVAGVGLEIAGLAWSQRLVARVVR
jgi:tight adherence protein B